MTETADQKTNYHFSLQATCFVAFMSAELAITCGEKSAVSLSISWDGSDFGYQGTLDAALALRFHDRIVSALRTYGKDASWDGGGLDGTDYRGSFRSPTLSVAEFRFWSPEPGTPPHSLACAALEAVPLDHCDGSFEYGLEKLREDLNIGVPLRWLWGNPPRLRMVGRLPFRESPQIESAFAQVPATGDLIVDVRLCDFIPNELIAKLKLLAQRTPPATWLIRADWQRDFLPPTIPGLRIVKDVQWQIQSL